MYFFILSIIISLYIYFLGIRLLTQSIAPTTNKAPVSRAAICSPCVLEAAGF
jgi:hypothetical protein